MMSSWGLVVTLVIIIAAAGGGFWYWTKIKETHGHAPSKPKDPALIQEPILISEPIQTPPIPNTVTKIPTEEPKSQEEAEGPSSESPEEQPAETPQPSRRPSESDAAAADESSGFIVDVGTQEVDSTGLPKQDPFLMELVEIRFRRPVTGSQITNFVNSAYEIAPHGLLQVLALEHSSQKWFKPDVLGMFEAVAFYVQLASSHAAFTEVSLSTLFTQVFQRMEMNLDGSAEMKEIPELVTKTSQLIELVKQFGVQITLLLRPMETVSIDEFEKEATLLGFKRRSAKHYEKIGDLVMDKNGRRLGNRKGAIEIRWLDDKNITISLNVPLIAPEESPLILLMKAANAFAAVFDAKIVGADGREISGATISLLKQELDRFYKEMRTRELEPGSLRSHRLLD